MAKYLKRFNNVEEANQQGTQGLFSPHVDIVSTNGGGYCQF